MAFCPKSYGTILLAAVLLCNPSLSSSAAFLCLLHFAFSLFQCQFHPEPFQLTMYFIQDCFKFPLGIHSTLTVSRAFSSSAGSSSPVSALVIVCSYLPCRVLPLVKCQLPVPEGLFLLNSP